MSLLLNTLSRLVITFLPRSKCLLISWLQSPSTVTLEPQKIKSATVSPSISHEVMGPDAMKVLIIYLRSQTSKVNSSKCYWFCKKQDLHRDKSTLWNKSRRSFKTEFVSSCITGKHFRTNFISSSIPIYYFYCSF